MSYQELAERLQSIQDLIGAKAILGWDQETKMPKKGSRIRSRQLSTLSGLIHERVTDPQIGDWLAAIDKDSLSPAERVNVEETQRGYERAVRVPARLVKTLTETCSLALEAWGKAKQEQDPSGFLPLLKTLIELKKEEVQHRAPGAHIYDELLDDYEPGLKEAQVERLFGELKTWLSPFVKEIVESSVKADVSVLRKGYPIAKQESFGKDTIGLMGFDFEAGRVDVSAHPFCGGVGPFDVRLTTRYLENEVLSSYFSFVHEAGHGLYEQGLNPEYFGLPAGSAASMAFHESQSRLWENCVARSQPFWEFMFPRFLKHFGVDQSALTFDSFFLAVNAVEPSLIRVESDEVTYNLHVILRYELERDLFNGSLEVEDLEQAWNSKMQDMLGMVPDTPANGFLQDIHWAFASFGYFPTYAYGNLYASQIFHSLRQDLPQLDEQLRQGQMGDLRDWLRDKIHAHGKLKKPEQLIRDISGEDLNPSYFTRYLEDKYRPLYKI